MKRKLLLLVALATLFAVGMASTGWAGHLANHRGTFTDATHVQFRMKTDQGTKVINVRDASDVMVHHFGPFGADTVGPWHTHPGPALVIVNSGEFRYQHTDCRIDTYGPGDVFIDPGQGYVHRGLFRAGTDVTGVFFGVPAGHGHTDGQVAEPDCGSPTW